ncbi:MAG: hypothetical protein P1Q69_13450 [Candidatus Thorarchaeota archaeon]|nr:hypothetical protein [Candidatus Thorarchaeota archaeon]
MFGQTPILTFDTLQINFTDIGSNLVAVFPYALPLLFGGILLLLFQRYLPNEERRRNMILLVGILGLASSILLILYAGFGSMWWGPEELTFGSYDVFIAILQRLTMMAFSYSIVYSMIYLAGVIIIFTFMAKYVISPPNPDFEVLRDQLKDLSDTASAVQSQKQELEVENKQLNEFLKEKEETLTLLHSELDALKDSVGERDSSLAEMESRLRATPVPMEDSGAEQELLETISNKDQTISKLQSEIADMRLILEGGTSSGDIPVEASADVSDKLQQLEHQLKVAESKVSDYGRRSETAAEVSDSVISDLAELISQVESSGLDGPTKSALSKLIQGLGRAVGRICSRPADEDDSPRVELIGAVMMVHEIVDAVKKLARG